MVLYQRPNIWIIVWALCALVGVLVPSGSLATAIRVVGMVALTIWALLEILSGATYFRRLLGGVVLLVTVLSAFKISL